MGAPQKGMAMEKESSGCSPTHLPHFCLFKPYLLIINNNINSTVPNILYMCAHKHTRGSRINDKRRGTLCKTKTIYKNTYIYIYQT